jgi:hypothetical protein
MRSFLIAVSFVLFAATCSAQTIYSINGTTLRTNEQFWGIPSESGGCGLLQFSDRTGADAPWIRHTSLHFGGRQFTVRLPALAVAAIALLALAFVVLLVSAVVGRVRRVHRYDNDA